jgi:hypothetical protein
VSVIPLARVDDKQTGMFFTFGDEKARGSEGNGRSLGRRMTGKEWPLDLDEPDAERVIVKIIPTQISVPAIYGGRLDRSAAGSSWERPSST